MDIAGTIRFAPTVKGTVGTLLIMVTGKPALSISLTIVAPQRLQVPHVDVIIAASIALSFIYCAISFPNLTELSREVIFPTVYR